MSAASMQCYISSTLCLNCQSDSIASESALNKPTPSRFSSIFRLLKLSSHRPDSHTQNQLLNARRPCNILFNKLPINNNNNNERTLRQQTHPILSYYYYSNTHYNSNELAQFELLLELLLLLLLAAEATTTTTLMMIMIGSIDETGANLLRLFLLRM